MSRRRKPLPTFAGIRCPQCKHEGSSVIDSRDCPGRDARRRRHECDKCKLRFTTMEILNAEYERLGIPELDRRMVRSAIASLRAIEKSLR